MREIAPGIFHWTAFHDAIGTDVSSYYVASAAAAIDPKQPPGGWAQLPDRPAQVLLSTGLHTRDAGACAQAFGIPIRVSHEAAQRIGDRLTVETFGAGDTVGEGISAVHIGVLCDDEGAFHIEAGGGALEIADAVTHTDGRLAFFRDSLLGDDPERVKRGLRQALAGLLDRDFEHLLFAHGEPIVGEGKAKLREFVGA
ncbi:MAG: hypothetical protein JOZ07_02240 [Solirubrobacterales bacterium]|nr:hypothetical protein [Solirubrobacterales bacterium]